MKKGKKKTKKKANRKRTRKPTRKPIRKPRRRLTTRTVGLLHNGSSVTFGGVGGPVQQDLRNALPGEVVIDAWYAADPHSPPIDEIADNLIAAAVRAGRRNYVIVAAGGPETAVMFREKTRLMLNPPAIVFTTVTNPGPATVNNPGGLGLVNNVYGRGGTNLTGMWGQTSERDSDRLEILFQLVQANITGPQDKIGALAAQRRPGKDLQFHDLDPRAVQLGLNPRQQLRRSPHDADDIVGIGQAFNFFGDHANRFQGVVVMAELLVQRSPRSLSPNRERFRPSNDLPMEGICRGGRPSQFRAKHKGRLCHGRAIRDENSRPPRGRARKYAGFDTRSINI